MIQAQPLAHDTPALTFEALFFRRLQAVTTRIHDTENLDQLMLDLSEDICRLFNAERLTLYAITDDPAMLVSRVKMRLTSTQQLKLPIGPQSIAGYVAFSGQALNIADVYDETALREIHPQLTFLQEVDKRSGFRSREMLVLPISYGKLPLGVLQIINNLSRKTFGALEVDGAQQLCKTLATAIRQRRGDSQSMRRRSQYSGLVIAGDISEEALLDATRVAREQGVGVESVLRAEHDISAAQIGASLSQFFGVPYTPFMPGRIRSDALHGLLKVDFVRAQRWVPLEDSPEGIILLCLDPEAVQMARWAQQVFPRAHLQYRVTTEQEFEETLAQLYGEAGMSAAGMSGGNIDQLLADMSAVPEDEGTAAADEDTLSAASDNELVKFVNQVIVDAWRQGASDIHIEPLPGKAKTGIRLRIDGALQPYVEVPSHMRDALIARLKIMCDLDISEKRRPQDGKIRFRRFGPLDIELRVATIPSAGGVEDVVMRILAAGEPIPLPKLGLTANTLERLQQALKKPHGLFYVCGPTGSGKTTTLHSILHSLNTPDTKIWTAEDPVEITQKGLRQVQVNRKAGIDFALVMRAFLRADPDIIMVGESRDRETVAMGVEASLTGHLVFSTLHTNSAPESIVRLLDMGMDPFNFADALLGVLAQRLARRLCECKQAYAPDAEELAAFAAEYADGLRALPQWQADPDGESSRLRDGWRAQYGGDGGLKFHRPVGCAKCQQTGYKGRVGLHELLIADDELKRLIQERARVATLVAVALLGGMRTLKMDGMEKVLMGLTDLAQVRAVCV